MARRRRPALPDPGLLPAELARFTEADWADEAADERHRQAHDELRDGSPPRSDRDHAAFLAGIIRYHRRQRWHRTRLEWAQDRGMSLGDLNRMAYGTDRRTPA